MCSLHCCCATNLVPEVMVYGAWQLTRAPCRLGAFGNYSRSLSLIDTQGLARKPPSDAEALVLDCPTSDCEGVDFCPSCMTQPQAFRVIQPHKDRDTLTKHHTHHSVHVQPKALEVLSRPRISSASPGSGLERDMLLALPHIDPELSHSHSMETGRGSTAESIKRGRDRSQAVTGPYQRNAHRCHPRDSGRPALSYSSLCERTLFPCCILSCLQCSF